MSSLDADLKSELASELASLHRIFGLTTLYVTHDSSEVSQSAHREIHV
jgi:ABC-type sugar transport system ATPase subunit